MVIMQCLIPGYRLSFAHISQPSPLQQLFHSSARCHSSHNVQYLQSHACSRSRATWLIRPSSDFCPYPTSFPVRGRSRSLASKIHPVTPTASARQSATSSTPSPSITRQILALALPALGALALDPLLSLIDTAFVGRLGVAPMAGVGLATLVLNISFSLFNFLCISVTPIVATAIHESPSSSSASRPVSTALSLAALLGTITAICLLVFTRPLAILLSAAPEALPHAIVYLRARAVAIPFALMSFVANGALRAFRDLRTPFAVAVLANTSNIVLDVLLMFHFRLGVLGAAIATSVSQVVAFSLMLAHLVAKRRLLLSDLLRVPPFSEVRPMLSAGFMLAVRTCSLLTTVAYATTSAAAMGVTSLAAFELCRQLWVFNSTLLDSLATAAQALVASAMASRAVRHARAIAKRAVTLTMGAAITIALPAVLVGPRLPALFTSSHEVRNVAAACIRMAALCAPVNGAVFAMDGVLAACADYRYLAAGIAMAAIVACSVITFVRIYRGGVVLLWASLNVLMIARAVVLFIRFFASRGPMALTSDKRDSCR